MVESIAAARQRHRFRLTGWVLMPEHVHLLLRPDAETPALGPVLKDLKSSVANRVLRRWRALNAAVLPRILDGQGKPHFWQAGGGYDRLIESDDEYDEKLAYIHRNPVKRGLVATDRAWRWSSAQWYDGATRDAAVLKLENR